MPDGTYNILFLCTGNTARSILAEALMNHFGNPKFRAYSAGSQPKGTVNPFSLIVLQKAHLSIEGLRSKSWDEFATPDAPKMDLVITVCDNAANEACPYWPGQPAMAHWGYPDPAAVAGTDDEKLRAFEQTLHTMQRRIQLLVNLPGTKLDKLSLQHQARALARS
jgi:protein-tyrosine-phosphatase